MEKEETVTTETTPKTTRGKKATTTSAPSRTIDDLRLSDRVSIDNLANWEISFVSEENGKDILISPSVKDFKRLTLAEVDSQVKTGNSAFVGVDDLGSHAVFRINDPLVREYVFGEDINPTQLTEEAVKELLAIDDTKKFKAALSELVVTNFEKRMIVNVCEKIGTDNVLSAKLKAIEEISGVDFE